MSLITSEFALNQNLAPITPQHGCYRPPSWPPPYDWVVSEDAQGNPLSRWIDDVWDLSFWAGRSFKLNFAGGGPGNSAPPLGPQNRHILRLLATWIIWGPRAEKTWRTLKSRFSRLRRVLVLCETEGVVATSIMRYPKLLDLLPGLYTHMGDKQRLVLDLDRLQCSADQIGFELVDQNGINQLSKAIRESSKEDIEQTAYIPPRIWTYLTLRLHNLLEEFIQFEQQISECFNFCVDSYAHNFGSLEAALKPKGTTHNCLPFTEQRHRKPGARTGRQFHGHFKLTADRFGITNLLQKWVSPNINSVGIKSLSAYLTLAQSAGLTYIATFTLQRIEEAASLRSDCLIWEEDPLLGRIPVICGETTKTDPDSDARWPTSPSVKIAVAVMTAIAKLRMRCAAANPFVNCSQHDQRNPVLLNRAFEPWCPATLSDYSKRPHVMPLFELTRRFPLLFDRKQITITESDLAQARMFTPNLSKRGKFTVGEVWPLAYHQLRRTSAINMFASGLLCDSSIQVILKHRTLLQTAYYGRNYTRLLFNENAESLMAEAKYEVMARQIESLVGERYVSPLGQKHKDELVINILGTKDFKALVKAGKQGEISFRETRLGGCTKNGHCEYGGIESVARCAGGDGGGPCREAMFDKLKHSSIEEQLQGIVHLQQATIPDSPRQRALQAEEQGLRNYLDAIRT